LSQSRAIIPEEAPVLAVEGLTKTFGAGGRFVHALKGITFVIRPGVVTGLIGPDGAGKTTLMRLVAGLLVPDGGTILALGLDATRESILVQASLGYMPQRFGLYEDLTVQENLDLYADLQGVSKTARAGRYAELMHMTGLTSFTHRLAGHLSGGMKQKLGLACTLVRAPRLLLLDEPTVGVDPVSRRELWSIVDRLVTREGMSALLSTAYLDEAERCQDVILLHDGKILGQGPPAKISEHMVGRTWAVTDPGRRPRGLQAWLAERLGVVDALVQGDHVRLVTERRDGPGNLAHLLDLPDATIQAVAPRFEDAFVDLLRTRTEGAVKRVHSVKGATPDALGNEGDAAVIQVKGLRRRFGDFWAVDGVSFEVRRGEIFGLLGANGAGKSTTFRMLCGLLPASSGSLRVAGFDLRHAASTARGSIGYMSQKFSLYGNLSVTQNLLFFASAYGLGGQMLRERLEWALEDFELEQYATQLSGDLSLGYKQRLAMACALMHRPQILFLDEPTSGVDPLARREFWQRINTLAWTGVTVLVTTHFMEEAEYCDRLAIMASGRILEMDEPSVIKARARSPERPEPSMEDAFIRLVTAAGAQAVA
jgi:drug efflux transport system ATP-binding protein